jgi:hypothetical protein
MEIFPGRDGGTEHVIIVTERTDATVCLAGPNLQAMFSSKRNPLPVTVMT